MIYKYTSHPKIAHKSKNEALDYKANTSKYHTSLKDVLVISCSEPFLNESNCWQTNAVIKHN